MYLKFYKFHFHVLKSDFNKKAIHHQIDSKKECFLLSASFTTKFELVFVLTLEKYFLLRFHFKGNRKNIPNKHLLIFKTSWRRLQHVFSITNFRLPRRLQDFLKTSPKTSWMEDEKMLRWRRLEDMSRIRLEDISWRCLEDMSWRRLQDVLETNKMFTGDMCI